MQPKKLWTRDFTIITLGTVISLLGSSMSGFALGLMMYDETESVLLYVLSLVIYNLPKIVMPMVAGPFLDKFSRKKVIYTLDFINSGIFLCMYFVINSGFFNYGIYMLVALFIGSIDSIYQVAYESLYPNLISEGNFSKAYSVSSMLYPLAQFMVPVAVYLKNIFGGVAPIFLINAVTFFVAACFETQIKAKEKHAGDIRDKYNFKVFWKDFVEGIRYIISEKGLLIITVYFCVTMFCDATYSALYLPFFKGIDFSGTVFGQFLAPMFTSVQGVLNVDGVSEMLYTFVIGCGVIGRLIGGAFHYVYKFPIDKKFAIACFVYTAICFLSGGMLFLPLAGMMIAQFLIGILGVTSYNIRISATQSYVPDSKRARFNGAFFMLNNLGSIVGQLLGGALAEVISIRAIVVIFSAVNLLGVIFIMFRNRKHVKLIYNRSV